MSDSAARPYVTARELAEYVASRGYAAVPIKTGGVGLVRVAGFTLQGPRGNKTTVINRPDGLFSLDEAKLWCDGVDYATGRVAEKKAVRS